MIRLSDSVCVDAPANVVWRALARLEDIRLWSEMVVDARCEGPRSRGVGAERTCDVRGGVTIRERWVAWEEGRSFAYEGVGLPFVARAVNEWTVLPVGHRTLVTTEAIVVLKGGPAGRVLERLLARRMSRMGSRALAAFKHLVEHGTPPRVRHARLSRAAPGC
jgi:hypothetical protein